ncbi:hypothetical protein ENBRE01_1184 [Enteropsectra breve]|nr:hypothetical protein ENBRE01_1184 [Enteropsectra breve]
MNKYMGLFVVPAFIAILVIVLIIHKLFSSGDTPQDESKNPIKDDRPLPLETENLPAETKETIKNDGSFIEEQPKTDASAIKKDDPLKEVAATEHGEQEVPEHSAKRPYTGETVSLGNAAEIEEKASTVITNYQSLTPSARIHFIAEMLVLSFLNASILFRCCIDDESYFQEKYQAQGRALKYLYERFMKSNSQMRIPHEIIEKDYKDLAVSMIHSCPIYRILLQLNKEYRDIDVKCIMSYVGPRIKRFCGCKDKAQNIRVKGVSQPIKILDIWETRKDMSDDLTLEKYMKDIKYPALELSEGREFISEKTAYLIYCTRTLIFYSDPMVKPSMNMPESFIHYRYYTEDSPVHRFYILKAVIVVDGERNDIFNMKVLHRPEKNVDEFVKVANEKGYYFLYADNLGSSAK